MIIRVRISDILRAKHIQNGESTLIMYSLRIITNFRAIAIEISYHSWSINSLLTGTTRLEAI